jgi:SAM-dependent methyltransferase
VHMERFPELPLPKNRAAHRGEPMYGSESTDPLVHYYDETVGTSGKQEVAWYLGRIRRYGGPVLDLACGTGRLSLLAAGEGLDVTALDQSQGMLTRFASKLALEPDEVRDRIRIVRSDMSDFELGQRFSTILCCDAFFHNLTVEGQIGCLRSVAAHLAPEGRFLFNLPRPTCEFILSAQKHGCGFGDGRTYLRPDDPGSILVERRNHADALSQLIETRLRFTLLDEHGVAEEQSESSWTTRYFWPYEAEHLLHRCGLEVEHHDGGYDCSPPGEGGQMVFVARLPIEDGHDVGA